jgi:hypothetical protein
MQKRSQENSYMSRPTPISIASIEKQPSTLGQLTEFCEQLKATVASLEKSSEQLGYIRATLLVNFGPDGLLGRELGVVIREPDNLTTHAMMVAVLQVLSTKAGSRAKFPQVEKSVDAFDP